MVAPEVAQALTAMAAQAAVIFVGQVRVIDRQPAHGFVDISFAVQRTLRGTTASTYVLREWAGLWTWQQDRYRTGERVLLLLRPRSNSGFSSPVGGLDGALPLLGGAQPPLLKADGEVAPDTGLPGSSGELANARVDLRWIAARVVRGVVPGQGVSGLTASEAAGTAAADSEIRPGLLGGSDPDPSWWPGPVSPLKTGSASGADGRPEHGVALGAVLAVLEAVPEAASDAR